MACHLERMPSLCLSSFVLVILSAASDSPGESPAESKDPYSYDAFNLATGICRDVVNREKTPEATADGKL